nr:hypothetical protein [Sphingomonas sp. PAMC 26605]
MGDDTDFDKLVWIEKPRGPDHCSRWPMIAQIRLEYRNERIGLLARVGQVHHQFGDVRSLELEARQHSVDIRESRPSLRRKITYADEFTFFIVRELARDIDCVVDAVALADNRVRLGRSRAEIERLNLDAGFAVLPLGARSAACAVPFMMEPATRTAAKIFEGIILSVLVVFA